MKSTEKKKKLRMRNLIDRRTPILIFLLFIVKILQFFKKIGIRSREDGWRRAARAFFQTEHSKFSLAVFRLNVWPERELPQVVDYKEAKQQLISRFAKFLQSHSDIHWQLDWEQFYVQRVKKNYLDFIDVTFDDDGNIEAIETFFTPDSFESHVIPGQIQEKITKAIISVYNATKAFPDKLRPVILKTKIKNYITRQSWADKNIIDDIFYFVDRVLGSTFIHFEILPDGDDMQFIRFSSIDFLRKKHPGWGTLNIFGRFSYSYSEIDLWVQVQHVALDGVPMQEMLNRLKQEWGIGGSCTIPRGLLQKITVPQLCSTMTDKGSVYKSIEFIDFEHFIQFRKNLAKKLEDKMTGSIAVVGLIIWLLGHHPAFYQRKFLFTVDIAESELGIRRPGFVFIRPSNYFDESDPMQGLIDYLNDFDEHIASTRRRQSESYELLELYAVFTPFMYTLIHKVLPKSLGDLVGTIGVSMIKSSDLFMAPSSEIHTGGFLAFSNLSLPTDDGRTAGIVTIKGPKENVLIYAEAIRDVMENCGTYLL